MSVLIKGMEMPETCSDCEWSYYVGNGRAMCKRVSMTDKTDIMTKRRADFCPLIEVPTPHGRLIDADKLNTYDLSPVNGFCVMGVTEEDIGLADTVIGAEE